MPRLLRGLIVNEISSVDKGANTYARVLIRKKQEDDP
jgi:hypothetical protein